MDERVAENGVQDGTLIDAPASKKDTRFKSPDRKKAIQRCTERRDEEPSTKRIDLEDIHMEEDDGIDVDSLAAEREDQLILYRAVFGT